MTEQTKELVYYFINMDEGILEPNQETLYTKMMGYGTIWRAIPNWNEGKVIYAGGKTFFTENEAIRMYLKLKETN
jgi:hypothetical protein